MITTNSAAARDNFNRWMDSIAFTTAEADRREVAATDEQTVPASLSEWLKASDKKISPEPKKHEQQPI